MYLVINTGCANENGKMRVLVKAESVTFHSEEYIYPQIQTPCEGDVTPKSTFKL